MIDTLTDFYLALPRDTQALLNVTGVLLALAAVIYAPRVVAAAWRFVWRKRGLSLRESFCALSAMYDSLKRDYDKLSRECAEGREPAKRVEVGFATVMTTSPDGTTTSRSEPVKPYHKMPNLALTGDAPGLVYQVQFEQRIAERVATAVSDELISLRRALEAKIDAQARGVDELAGRVNALAGLVSMLKDRLAEQRDKRDADDARKGPSFTDSVSQPGSMARWWKLYSLSDAYFARVKNAMRGEAVESVPIGPPLERGYNYTTGEARALAARAPNEYTREVMLAMARHIEDEHRKAQASKLTVTGMIDPSGVRVDAKPDASWPPKPGSKWRVTRGSDDTQSRFQTGAIVIATGVKTGHNIAGSGG